MPIKINNYIIFINNLCNQKCNFCSAKDKMKEKKEISLKDIFKNILNK
jgi:MoaA/NifB/PqqE/SkfB family radical SAM enzyme